MTETDVTFILSRTLFPYRRFVLVPNASWGMFPWEVDLAAMNVRGYVHEIEIKVSSGDLRRDLKKDKHRLRVEAPYREHFRFFWYAMPRQVWETVQRTPPALTLPADAGLILIDGDNAYAQVQAQVNTHAKKLTADERFQLARLGTIRYWTRKAA